MGIQMFIRLDVRSDGRTETLTCVHRTLSPMGPLPEKGRKSKSHYSDLKGPPSSLIDPHSPLRPAQLLLRPSRFPLRPSQVPLRPS